MQTLDTSTAGLIALGGDDPRWIWAFTCSTVGCDCRTALVLSTGGDRETLLARGAPIRDAWLRGQSHAKAAAAIEGVTAFAIDIDDGELFPAYSEDPFEALDLDAHPDARDVVDRIDGDTLEELGRLWYRGKGLPNPEETSRAAERIEVEDWEPSDMVAWDEAMVGVRQDVFRVGEHVYAAIDHYCASEGCSCGEVLVDFAPVGVRGTALPTLLPGAVRVYKHGEATVEPEHEEHRERLEQLWSAFQKRHPRYRDRFARRAAVMQSLAGRIVGAPHAEVARRAAKVGRNDPCPCGSGKKYKKCCGAA